MTDLIERLIADWSRERADLDASPMRIVGRILILAETLRKRAEQTLQPFGLCYTDLDVLATLRRSGAPFALRPAQLLDTVLIASGSMTACIDRLEKRQWVERIAAPDDRRGRIVRLTKEGHELVDRAIAARFEQAEAFVAKLSTQDRQALEPLLETLLIAHSAD